MDLVDSYKSLNESLIHAGIQTQSRVNIRYIDSERLEMEGLDALKEVDAILVPGGFGDRGIEGKISAVRHARENKIPYLGICLGMQVAVIEYARNKANLTDANSTEFQSDTPHPVIALITEWSNEDGTTQTRNQASDLGGSMRLGAQTCTLQKGSLVRQIYNKDKIAERHRHRYEFNNSYRQQLEKAGLRIAAVSQDNDLVEIIENTEHPWFVGCQFHPEFTSTPRDGHPLFTGFIQAALDYRRGREKKLKAVS